MEKMTLELWTSIVRGLTILKPYIGELNIDPVPNSFHNGTVTIGVILGLEAPNEAETIQLRLLGWVFDGEYITLYVPNIYEVPTMDELNEVNTGSIPVFPACVCPVGEMVSRLLYTQNSGVRFPHRVLSD